MCCFEFMQHAKDCKALCKLYAHRNHFITEMQPSLGYRVVSRWSEHSTLQKSRKGGKTGPRMMGQTHIYKTCLVVSNVCTGKKEPYISRSHPPEM